MDNRVKLDKPNNFLISVNNQKVTKEGVKNFFKNIVSKKSQEILKKIPRKQKEKKDIIAAAYKDIAKLFPPLLKPENEQSELKTQKSE